MTQSRIDPYRAGAWWVIEEFDLMALLSRAAEGEEPVDIYLELAANAAQGSGGAGR